MFNKDEDDMLEHLEQGDVAETIQIFFEQSSLLQPSTQSHLTIQEVIKKLFFCTENEDSIIKIREAKILVAKKKN